MGTRPTFTLPEGLNLTLTADQIAIEYDGNIDVEEDLGRRFTIIRTGGDLSVRLPQVSGDLIAEGILRVSGDVLDGGTLKGREVLLGRQTIRCRVITATERIVLGAGTVNCDIMMAPEITIDPKAQGRVTVLECNNDRGASKIKGCLSLADYEDMFGNSREFLTQRGLAPLSTDNIVTKPTSPDRGYQPSPSPAPQVMNPPPLLSSTPSPVTRTETPTRADVPARNEPPARRPEPNNGQKPPVRNQRKDIEEDVEDPLSLSLDDLEPLVEAVEAGVTEETNDLQQRLNDALGRITACYEGSDLPPAIEELRSLVEHRDYDGLRQSITEVWNGLLGFHQKRGIRPHHQVTHAFNVIHGLVST